MIPVVVYSRGGGVNGLATIRSLGRRGVETHLVVRRHSNNLAARSRFCTKIHYLEEETTDALWQALSTIADSTSTKPILICDSDETLHLAATCVDQLAPRYVLMNPLDRFQQMQNKQFQTDTATKAGIPIPRSWYITNWDELRQVKASPGRRLIVKPNPSVFVKTAPFKIFHADDAADAEKRLRDYVADPAGMIVQEYIEGGDKNMWVVSGYRSADGKKTTMLTMSKDKQSGSGAGGVAIIGRTWDRTDLKALTQRLVEAFSYFGPFAIEFKYCATQNQFVFIEANFRTARVHVIGRRVGADLPALMYADLSNQAEFAQQPPPLDRVAWYYDMRGCIETMPKTKDFWAVCGMIKNVCCAPFRTCEWAVHAWDDMSPMRFATRELAGEICARVGRRLGLLKR